VLRTGHVRLHELQRSCLERCNRLPDRRVLRDIDTDVRGVELVERPHADPADNHAVDLFALKGLERHAHAVTLMLIVVADRSAASAVGVHDHESRRRTEVGADRALKPLVFIDWNADIHGYFFSESPFRQFSSLAGSSPQACMSRIAQKAAGVPSSGLVVVHAAAAAFLDLHRAALDVQRLSMHERVRQFAVSRINDPAEGRAGNIHWLGCLFLVDAAHLTTTSKPWYELSGCPRGVLSGHTPIARTGCFEAGARRKR